jgi:hypothetical protein
MSKLVLGVVTVLVAVYMQQAGRAKVPRIEHAIPWATSGVWLKAETHVHTKFSDGTFTVDEVAGHAAANGCDVIAITDHTDRRLGAATPEYHAAITAARAKFPKLVILTGVEWNVPPARGEDHAVVLFPPSSDSAQITGEFKKLFDDYDREPLPPETLSSAFTWLRARGASAAERPIVFLNHPSRKARDVDAVTSRMAELWAAGKGVFAGTEGAPGHQKAKPLGAYGGVLRPADRWDPSIASPAGAWDVRLAAGDRVWGALATADFHNEGMGDFWPCEFSSTWVHAPERSVTGVLRALSAGSFAGVHGGIAGRVQLEVEVPGLSRPVLAGETLVAPAGGQATFRVRADVPATDWQGRPNRLDEVELIGIDGNGARVLARLPWDPAQPLVSHSSELPAGRFAVRARGRRVVEDGDDLLFYSNPVFVNIPGQ